MWLRQALQTQPSPATKRASVEPATCHHANTRVAHTQATQRPKHHGTHLRMLPITDSIRARSTSCTFASSACVQRTATHTMHQCTQRLDALRAIRGGTGVGPTSFPPSRPERNTNETTTQNGLLSRTNLGNGRLPPLGPGPHLVLYPPGGLKAPHVQLPDVFSGPCGHRGAVLAPRPLDLQGFGRPVVVVVGG
jgi:hypothetical protein